MADPNVLPPTHAFDETGTLPENFIENEQRPLALRNVRALATLFGSFFTESFAMRDANGVPVDPSKYQFGLFSELISEKTGKEVCGAVIVTDATVAAPVFIDYHCVGGPWGATNEQIIALFAQLNGDDRPVSWPNILGKPDAFVPAHHLQDIGDLYGAEYWVAAIDRLAQAYLMGDNASHDEIFRRIDQNRQDINDALAQLNTSLRQYIDQGDSNLQGKIDALTDVVDQHIANKLNPHQVTAAQAGTYTQAQIDQLLTGLNNALAGYVKKNVGEDLALTNSNGQLYAFLNGTYRLIWPPQWQ